MWFSEQSSRPQSHWPSACCPYARPSISTRFFNLWVCGGGPWCDNKRWLGRGCHSECIVNKCFCVCVCASLFPLPVDMPTKDIHNKFTHKRIHIHGQTRVDIYTAYMKTFICNRMDPTYPTPGHPPHPQTTRRGMLWLLPAPARC